MAKEYDTFIYSFSELPEGKDVTIAVRDLTPGTHKYETTFVRARVSPKPSKKAGESKMWIVFNTGVSHPQPYYINILENVGSTIPGKPSPK